MIETRFSRHEALIGKQGQELIQRAKVAIVGLGGTGSHVNQQLAYLGISDFTLIDNDDADITSLNRLIGMENDDVGKAKVELAARLIRRIQPTATILAIKQSVRTQEALDALKKADIVFGCVDNDGIRFILNEFCVAYEKPYLDIATDTEDGVGGRLVFTFNDLSCLYCLNELSQKDIRGELASEQERQEHERLYGVALDQLGVTGPSVVSLNGILASLAVTEFLNYITGLRVPNRYLCYRGNTGIVTRSSDEPGKRCPYCQELRGKKHLANIERYIDLVSENA